MNKLSVNTESFSPLFNEYFRRKDMTNVIQLSKRLETVANYIHDSSYFVDIGSDHAYLPCYVCINKPNVRAIAGEVNLGPYERAKDTVKSYHLDNKIDVRLGNGLDIITDNDKIDTISIAGMGGSLIKSILTDGQKKLIKINRIIAQPNNNAYAVRKFLKKHHYVIVAEEIIEENGHIYEIIVSDYSIKEKPNQIADEEEKSFLFGPLLMAEKSFTFIKKWEAEKEKLNKVINQMKQAKKENEQKIAEFEQQVKWIEEVLL